MQSHFLQFRTRSGRNSVRAASDSRRKGLPGGSVAVGTPTQWLLAAFFEDDPQKCSWLAERKGVQRLKKAMPIPFVSSE